MSSSENENPVFSLKTVFLTAATALGLDVLFSGPLSHNSIIGSFLMAAATGFVVPPIDWLAINIFGFEDPLSATGLSKDTASGAMVFE